MPVASHPQFTCIPPSTPHTCLIYDRTTSLKVHVPFLLKILPASPLPQGWAPISYSHSCLQPQPNLNYTLLLSSLSPLTTCPLERMSNPLLASSCLCIFVNFTCFLWTCPIPTMSMKPSPTGLILSLFCYSFSHVLQYSYFFILIQKVKSFKGRKLFTAAFELYTYRKTIDT